MGFLAGHLAPSTAATAARLGEGLLHARAEAGQLPAPGREQKAGPARLSPWKGGSCHLWPCAAGPEQQMSLS